MWRAAAKSVPRPKNAIHKKMNTKNRIYTRAKWHDYGGGAYFVTICTKNRVHYFGEICKVAARNEQVAARHDPTAACDVCRVVACGDRIAYGDQNAVMQLSEIGQCVSENLQNITTHYPYAEIPLFVVMPNHIHAIIFIDGEKTPYQRRAVVKQAASHDEQAATRNEQVAARHDPANTARCCRVVACGDQKENSCGDQKENSCGDQNENSCGDQNENSCGGQNSTDKNAYMQKTAYMQGWLSIVIGGMKSAVTKYANANNIEFMWQTRFDDRIIRSQEMMNRIADYIENNVSLWESDCFNSNTQPK